MFHVEHSLCLRQAFSKVSFFKACLDSKSQALVHANEFLILRYVWSRMYQHNVLLNAYQSINRIGKRESSFEDSELSFCKTLNTQVRNSL